MCLTVDEDACSAMLNDWGIIDAAVKALSKDVEKGAKIWSSLLQVQGKRRRPRFLA